MKREDDVCEVFCFDTDAVETVQKNMPGESDAQYLSEFFKILGDKSRVKLLFALMQKELCVCDLATILEISPSAVSHQLRLLRSARLVKYRRAGKNAYYSIDDDHVYSILAQGLEHLGHD